MDELIWALWCYTWVYDACSDAVYMQISQWYFWDCPFSFLWFLMWYCGRALGLPFRSAENEKVCWITQVFKAFWEKLLFKDVSFPSCVPKESTTKKENNASDLIEKIWKEISKSSTFCRFFSVDEVSCSEHVHGSINPQNPGSCTASGDAAPIVPWFLGKRRKRWMWETGGWCTVFLIRQLDCLFVFSIV